jgi:hypothetical protein
VQHCTAGLPPVQDLTGLLQALDEGTRGRGDDGTVGSGQWAVALFVVTGGQDELLFPVLYCYSSTIPPSVLRPPYSVLHATCYMLHPTCSIQVQVQETANNSSCFTAVIASACASRPKTDRAVGWQTLRLWSFPKDVGLSGGLTLTSLSIIDRRR